VETTLKRGDNLTVLANGKVLFSGKVTDPKGKVSVTVPAETFGPGINVITFFRNAGEKNKKSTYFSLLMPGEKRTAAGEPDLPWETAPAEAELSAPAETGPATDATSAPLPETEENGPRLTDWLPPVGVALAAVLASAFVILRRKNPEKERDGK
jgi:hypothetical protein